MLILVTVISKLIVRKKMAAQEKILADVALSQYKNFNSPSHSLPTMLWERYVLILNLN